MGTKRQVECFGPIRTMKVITQQQLPNAHFTPSLSHPASLSEMLGTNTTPKIETARSPGTFITTYPIKRCNNQQGHNLNKYRLHFKIVPIVRILFCRDKLLGGLPRIKRVKYDNIEKSFRYE